MHSNHAQPIPGAGLLVAPDAPGADPRPRSLSLAPGDRKLVFDAVLGLDRWFDSMRQPGGYGGPVVHWWRDCLSYVGPGLDWRYEGIIIGYLNLWAGTGEHTWLNKARQAGDDLVHGQLPNGNFRNSNFEQNPNTGGTPHEAACDLALLRLAQALRSIGDSDFEGFVHAAERNLKAFFIGRLWDSDAHSFRDDPSIPSFVPNKACTLIEALFTLARFRKDEQWVEGYALPCLEIVLEHQIGGGPLDGAIYQNSFGAHKIEKYFPFYIARCLPALLEGWAWSGDDRFADAARRAAGFIQRCRYEDGSFPQVVYPGRRVNRYPQWIAATGDILRVLDLAGSVGVVFDAHPTLRWLLTGQRPDGSFRTASGFANAAFLSRHQDPRDDLGVCGWSDKTFRCLANLLRGEQTQNA